MIRSLETRLLLAAAALLAAGCQPDFTQPMKLGGVQVPAATLNSGKEAYTLYCRSCHGDKGDGTGPASLGLRPPPRDFTVGVFKFAAVEAGNLPHDDDLIRIVKGGLHGTAMLAWDVQESTLRDIIQYIKTFSPRWKDELPGDAIKTTPDPWPAAKNDEAVARGKKIYHGLAQCLTCHPSYATKQEIFDASKELTGNGTTDFRDAMYEPELKESDYSDRHYPKDKEGNYPKLKILPPDFLYSDVRSGTALPDLYRTIASGVGGTAMPKWQGVLPETDLWAMVHYVRSLIDTKGTPAEDRLRLALAKQPPFTPPPEPPSDEGAAPKK
jgi:mono/diheme cytochrome c family protein